MYKKNYTFSQWINYIETFNQNKRENLFELKIIAKKLNLLRSKSFFFIVGGTNGKGTTCSMMERVLLDSGYKVGLYTSPHLIHYKERIRINGLCLDNNDHVFSFLAIESMRNNISLTYFEFITLSALFLFNQHSLDVVILEVGLGGRLDATNIIDADVSIITNIGIDHTSLLGIDRFSIGREKSGIFRKGKIAVIGEKNIPYSIVQVAQEKKTILKQIDVDWFWKKQNINSWKFIHSNIQLYSLPVPKIPLSNAAIALSALFYSSLKINLNKLKNAISNVQLSGRFQIISSSPCIILDVAHNVHAAFYLAKKLDEVNINKKKIYAIFGVLKDKDILGIIEVLKKKIYYWYAVGLQVNRGATIEDLKNISPFHNMLFFETIYDAWKSINKVITKKDIILVFGSFFTVSEFISIKNSRLIF